MAKRITATDPPGDGKPAFASRLKSLREVAGITQEQLAQRTGLHVGAIFKLEQGTREPGWATVQLLAQALGVDCSVFVDVGLKLPEGEIETTPPAAEPKKKPRKKKEK